MKEKKESDDINSMSFEEALMELEEIVRKLESGTGELDEAIDSYSRGAELKKHCELKLKDAQTRIDKIVKDTNGVSKIEIIKFDE